MNTLKAVGIAIVAASVVALGYITFKYYEEATSAQQNSSTQQTSSQTYSVHIYNSCDYSITVNYTDVNDNQKSTTLLPGMGITIDVQANSPLSITDNNGNQMLSPTPIQGNANITTCPSNLFQQVVINYVPEVTQVKTQTVSGCVGSSCSSTATQPITTVGNPFYKVVVYNNCNEYLTIKYYMYNTADGKIYQITDTIDPHSSQTLYVAAGTYIEVHYPGWWIFPGPTKRFGPINSDQQIIICKTQTSYNLMPIY